jgi:hypothetical protein
MRAIWVPKWPYEQTYPQKLGKKMVTGEGELFSQFDSAHHTIFDNASPSPSSPDQRNRCHLAGGELKPA